ncbi:MAG: hypothetical protein ABFD69_03105 [Candidatus Sumerlaeia bacterium]
MLVLAAGVFISQARASDLVYRGRLHAELVRQVPDLLKGFDPGTGRFGKGIFICTDQHPMFALAVAYSIPGSAYYKDSALLDVIMKAGDALIAAQDADGKWRFDKKDGSYWGQIYMPWTYSRWIRTYAIIKYDMPQARRDKWEKALVKGFDGISRTALKGRANIPTHDAMALYIAGVVLGRSGWSEQAARYIRGMAAAQSEGGFWSEHAGPLVGYNYVYVEAIGTYYACSSDKSVLPALRRAARYHWEMTYPDGRCVETVDERNPYGDRINPGNVGFTYTPEGRACLARQWGLLDWKLGSDLIASLLLHGVEGSLAGQPAAGTFVLNDHGQPRAMTLRSGPWFVALSAFTAPLSESRWIQDRQNFVSIYHQETGLYAGGGNTKLQPAWSSFTVGNTALLRHKAGDADPEFKPAGELYHIPSEARLAPGADPQLDLVYGPVNCHIKLKIEPAGVASYEIWASGRTKLPVVAHLTLIPRLGKPLKTGGGFNGVLGKKRIDLDAAGLGGKMNYGGMQLTLPEGTALHWPALPHDPYVKDGGARPEQGRIELRIPLTPDGGIKTVRLKLETGNE